MMVHFVIAAATLTIAGVAGLVAMVIALYAVSVALEAASRRKNRKKEE